MMHDMPSNKARGSIVFAHTLAPKSELELPVILPSLRLHGQRIEEWHDWRVVDKVPA
jgi:hypothetical protein